ncbi:MAG TPA: shikimate dehydrogenase [Candidatus Binataceae bacterium]|nr:shikimate dehydrogenase [Candidatus Binataceae bacterium]
MPAQHPPASISGRTLVTAVFGDPVEHSMSPAMHNEAYAALEMDRVYLAFHVTPKNFRAALNSLPALGILGVNLTVPHKEAAARILKHLSTEAKLLRAVNCVINDRGKLRGDNTDARGLERDLRSLGVDVRSQLAVVIGAGGAAAAAVLALTRMGVGRIVIANRTRGRAVALARRFKSSRLKLEPRGLDALTDAPLLADAALVLNATSMGLTTSAFAPLDYAATSSRCFFYDAIYRAEATPFLREAIALDRPHADGAGMLINQGELAFELFNGIAPPEGVMRRALLSRLGRTT